MGKRILFVEDETDMVYAVTFQLKAAGYDVIVAQDGDKGLEMAKKQKPDLIILDVMLPKIDGYKLCGILKAAPAYQRIPIILFTARAQESDKKAGQAAKADAYITKPFDPQALLAKIRELLVES